MVTVDWFYWSTYPLSRYNALVGG